VSWPANIDISSASATNFNRFNRDFGSIIVIIKCDGSKSSIIPPTTDIDSDLRSALTKFVSDTKVTVGTQCHEQMFLVRFHVPSGTMNEVEVSPPHR